MDARYMFLSLQTALCFVMNFKSIVKYGLSGCLTYFRFPPAIVNVSNWDTNLLTGSNKRINYSLRVANNSVLEDCMILKGLENLFQWRIYLIPVTLDWQVLDCRVENWSVPYKVEMITQKGIAYEHVYRNFTQSEQSILAQNKFVSFHY